MGDGIAWSETELPAPGIVPPVLVIDPGLDVVRGVLRIPATHEPTSDQMPHSLKAMIVDGEPLARSLLASLLAEHGNMEVIGMAGSVAECRALLAWQTPDVVFLDVDMPGGSGLELRPDLPPSTSTIFVTTHAHHALQAFEFGARDYLLKPVNLPRLRLAIERIVQVTSAASGAAVEDPEIVETFAADGRITRILTAEILWIEAHQNYTRVFLVGDTPGPLVSRSMAEWEQGLAGADFTRLGRSVIVNVGLIRTVSWVSRDETMVDFIHGGQALKLGRTSALRLKERLREGALGRVGG